MRKRQANKNEMTIALLSSVVSAETYAEIAIDVCRQYGYLSCMYNTVIVHKPMRV